uniref:NADH-ubiquinone oxidoreductase chain 5 n=1 Tax=Amblyomma fimbriatum TaxID=65641 RepID=H9M769_9ACAR|nr:NADH dehydrogenase subunit 5 [Amblyomma fimbriatum]AET63086.1 NADH dehydrogenase subunit 5 [Amblyomma fimbriatum]
MFIYWGIILLMMSFLFLMFFIINFLTSNLLILEYILYTNQGLDLKFYFLFDWVSTLFTMIVLMISSMVLFFSNSYMKEDKNKLSFCYIVLLFVLSMVMLILMPNMFMMILGWDGLGLVSYCLVIYYQSENSYNSGMITIISNRVGDVMVMLSLIFFVNFGTFDFMSFQNFELICGIMILTAGLTKSAQIPFSAWLPAAMAAPTPVSSLVHSSTLVTAGVYLLIRFSFMFKIELNSLILLKISLLTMVMSGINAFFENDFKKIIAFSTLSQLSLMMISISLKMPEFAFFHLIIHAIFKSMLFLCAGLVIHYFQGIQDIRMLGNFFNFSPLISSCLMISILSLIGFPFVGGFFSKDLIVEFFLFKMNNFIYFLIFMLGISFTFFYCFRLVYILLLKGAMSLAVSKFNLDFFMKFPILILTLMVIIFSNLLNWMINLNLNLIFISFPSKNFVIILLFMMIFMYIFMKKCYILKKKNWFFLKKIWHLSFLSSYVMLMKSKTMIKFNLTDWTWMEILGPSFLKMNTMKSFEMNLLFEIKNLTKILIIIFLMILVFLV